MTKLRPSFSAEADEDVCYVTHLDKKFIKVYMTYVLEKIQPADLAKILGDLDQDPYRKKHIVAERVFTATSDVMWAVDRDSNSYIFLAPTTREQAINPRFCFFYRNYWYEFYVDALFGNLVKFVVEEPKEGEARDEFRAHVKAALFSIGRYAKGSGDLLNSVVAEFDEEI